MNEISLLPRCSQESCVLIKVTVDLHQANQRSSLQGKVSPIPKSRSLDDACAFKGIVSDKEEDVNYFIPCLLQVRARIRITTRITVSLMTRVGVRAKDC